MGLDIPYEYLGNDENYRPDFLVRLINEFNLLLEIKGWEGHEPERTNAKHNAARKWVTAVNNLGDFGKWAFLVCWEPDLSDLLPSVSRLVAGKAEVVAK